MSEPSAILSLSPPDLYSPTRRDDLAAVIRDAVLSAPHTTMNEEHLLTATRDFISALEKDDIPHVLVGGLAVLQYIEGRNTRDIGLIMAVEDLERLPDLVLHEKNEWFGSADVGPLRVDFLFTDNPFFERIAKEHAEERDFMGTRLRCATPEGIILLKLFALPSLYRQGQIDRAALYETDILMLLRHSPVEDAVLESQLVAYMTATDIKALLEVLAEIRGRMEKATRF
ncbi:MAG: hypothetical protein QM496_22080 [Verrucomicrobiota bacterium]